MKKEKIEINKNNYEGYTKLYDTYFFNKGDETRIYKAILGGILISAIGVVGLLYSPVPLLSGLVLLLAISMTVGSFHDIIFEKQKKVKEKYPYLEDKISKQELEESLMDVKIVTKDNHGYIRTDTKEFEKTLEKYETIKKQYLEEQKFNYNIPLEWNTYIPDKKVKTMVKTRKRE